MNDEILSRKRILYCGRKNEKVERDLYEIVKKIAEDFNISEEEYLDKLPKVRVTKKVIHRSEYIYMSEPPKKRDFPLFVEMMFYEPRNNYIFINPIFVGYYGGYGEEAAHFLRYIFQPNEKTTEICEFFGSFGGYLVSKENEPWWFSEYIEKRKDGIRNISKNWVDKLKSEEHRNFILGRDKKILSVNDKLLKPELEIMEDVDGFIKSSVEMIEDMRDIEIESLGAHHSGYNLTASIVDVGSANEFLELYPDIIRLPNDEVRKHINEYLEKKKSFRNWRYHLKCFGRIIKNKIITKTVKFGFEET